MADGLDVSRAPRGEIAAAALVEAVTRIGDLAERHYLEIKGPRDLSSKVDKQKVAKFILGAANRLSEVAAEAFEGCAVMIIGITENGIKGVPRIEMLELSKVVQPFLGAPGPRWDVFRVPVETPDREVLVVVVEPPRRGQPVYICRSSGEGLIDGRVYIRADGETREANSDEQDALRERANSSTSAPVDLDVSVAGMVVPILVDDEQTLDEYVAITRRRLLDALPTPVQKPEADPELMSFISSAGRGPDDTTLTTALSGLAKLAASEAGLFPPTAENRTEQEYVAEIDNWEAKLRTTWPDAVIRLAGYATSAAEIAVQNRTQTFLHDVEVRLHLEGAVVSVDYHERPDRIEDIHHHLPKPPRRWGPAPVDFGRYLRMPELVGPTFATDLRRPSSSWKNSGSVDVEVEVGDLRPEATFVTDDEEAVLAIFGEAPESIQGTWRATARGYNEVFKGNCVVEVTDARDLTEPLRYLLGLESPSDNEE